MNTYIKFLVFFIIVSFIFSNHTSAKTRLIYSSGHVIEMEEFKIDNIETLYNSANGFRPTLYFDFLNDKQLILSKGNGEIYIFNEFKKDFKKQTTNLNQIFLDQLKISSNYKQRFGGPGIRDIRVDIEKNNLFVTLISTDENHCLRLELLNASVKDLFFTKVWETPCVETSNAHSTGGTIEIDKKYVYLTVGDFWYENNNNAQNLKSYFGKILRFDKTKILKKEKIHPEIFSIGHRNPQGLQILKNNRLIATEHGPAGGDEINIIKNNKNYGWPIVSSGLSYNLKNPDKYKNNSKENFEEPLFTFLKAVGVSSVVVYDHNKFSRWKQNFLVATLKNRSIFRLNFNKTGEDDYKINGIECIKIGQRIRKLRVNNDGGLYLTTDEGNLLSLNPFTNSDYGQKYSGPEYPEIFGSFTGPMNFCK